MYEHPPGPPKDGSPLENQQVEQAAMEEQMVVNEEPLVVKVSDAAPQVIAEARHDAGHVMDENRHGAAEGAVENLILNEVAAAAAPGTGAAPAEERQKEGMEVLAEALRASESAEAEQHMPVAEKREENAAEPESTEQGGTGVDQSAAAPPPQQ